MDKKKALEELAMQERIAKQQITTATNKLGEIRKKKETLSLKPQLTDHALIRYLERVYNLDINQIKHDIMTPTIISAIENGASKITYNGVQFIVQNKRIVTVYE